MRIFPFVLGTVPIFLIRLLRLGVKSADSLGKGTGEFGYRLWDPA